MERITKFMAIAIGLCLGMCVAVLAQTGAPAPQAAAPGPPPTQKFGLPLAPPSGTTSPFVSVPTPTPAAAPSDPTAATAPPPAAPAPPDPAAAPAPASATPAPAAPPPDVSAASSAVGIPSPVKMVFVTITGAKQGTLANRIAVAKYLFQPSLIINRASGTPTGKKNAPVTFTKLWDTVSIPLLTAMQNNETLTTVVFDFVAADNTEVFTVTLTNATINSINQSMDAVSGTPLEDIRLTYQKLQIQDSAKQVANISN